MMGRVLFGVLVLFLHQYQYVFGLNNGLALTPPMGWLQWQRFRCNQDCDKDPNNCISEKLFMEMADHLASDGYLDAGYQYVNIDDCWSAKERDANGKLYAHPDRFPHGMKYLVDYVHSKGLKLGIYADLGTKTCSGFPGTLGHIQEDADTFAEWGVDMLKLDGCHSSEEIYNTDYPTMSKALNMTGRPIVYSCSWPDYVESPIYSVIAENCNLWRNAHDIEDSWDSVLTIIDIYGNNQDIFQQYAGPGHWNDPDMLIIGDFGLSLDQQKVQMAMWAIFASPLLMSNDLRSMPPESKEILQNMEIIKVNQDPLGIQGRLINYSAVAETRRVYSRPLQNFNVAVALLNTQESGIPCNVTFSFQDVGLKTVAASIRDLYAMKDIGVHFTSFTALVNPSGVRLFRLAPVQKRADENILK